MIIPECALCRGYYGKRSNNFADRISGYFADGLRKKCDSTGQQSVRCDQKVAENYDYVLIDASSVGLTADPMSLSQIASAALFVVRYDTATLREISDALERIEKSGVSILGCVVNGVQVSERNIKNPAAEKEKMKQAEYREENESEPLMNLQETLTGDSENTDHNIQSLVAQFTEEGKTGLPDDVQEIRSGDGFVDLLFSTESNEESIPAKEAAASEEESIPAKEAAVSEERKKDRE